MTLTYKNYIITGTAEELKKFIDLMENNNTTVSSNIDINKIPHGTVQIFDPHTGTYVEGNIKNIAVPDGTTNKCSYPNNVCENH